MTMNIEPLKFQDSDITTLTPKQQRFFTLYISGQYTNAKIAELLGVHPNTISNWLRDDAVKGLMEIYQKEEFEMNHKRLKALSGEAIQTMAELMQSPIDGVRYQASKDILDRTDFKPVSKREVKTEVYSYEEKIQDMANITVTDEELLQFIEGEDYEVIEE